MTNPEMINVRLELFTAETIDGRRENIAIFPKTFNSHKGHLSIENHGTGRLVLFDGKIGKNETGRKALKSHIKHPRRKDDEKQQQTST